MILNISPMQSFSIFLISSINHTLLLFLFILLVDWLILKDRGWFWLLSILAWVLLDEGRIERIVTLGLILLAIANVYAGVLAIVIKGERAWPLKRSDDSNSIAHHLLAVHGVYILVLVSHELHHPGHLLVMRACTRPPTSHLNRRVLGYWLETGIVWVKGLNHFLYLLNVYKG